VLAYGGIMKIGDKVKTTDGEGVIIDIESFKYSAHVRYFVRLDRPPEQQRKMHDYFHGIYYDSNEVEKC
jgi:hypothetical protein